MEERNTYKLGFYSAVINMLEPEMFLHLKECSQMCERFVIGIPDDYIMVRLFGEEKQYSCEAMKSLLADFSWVDDVIIMNWEMLSRQKIYGQIPYDVCFYGSEYGRQFEEDRAFWKEKGIAALPVIPETIAFDTQYDALRIALRNVTKEQKVILYGTENYFDYYMTYYAQYREPAYAIDDAEEKWGNYKAGVLIQNPSTLRAEQVEEVLIIICSDKCDEARKRMKEFGNFNYRTLFVNNKIALLDEFYVSRLDEENYLIQAHEILHHLMKEFDRVCTKYGLHYYILFGSLIGVLRHQGIIPWDDDIDVGMPRADFDRLREIAHKEWNTEEFTFLNYDEFGNNAFLDCMPRLFYNKATLPTKVFDKVEGKATAEVKNKMFIDIYILDPASRNQKKHMITMKLMKGVYALCMGHRAPIDYAEYESLPRHVLLAMKMAHRTGKCIPFKLLMAVWDRLCRYAAKEECDDYFMSSCAITCIERKFSQAFFGEGQRAKFYDMEVLVPSEYDAFLNAIAYFNYMQFPPISSRRPSHYFMNTDMKIWSWNVKKAARNTKGR